MSCFPRNDGPGSGQSGAGAATLLLTGFEPFGGDGFNPSGEIVRRLHGRVTGGGSVRISGRVLPVSGPAAWRQLAAAIRRLRPHWVVAMGVSGRDGVCLESTAWNWQDYRIPDNAGLQPAGLPVLRRGGRPESLHCGLDLAEIAGGKPDGTAPAVPALPVRVSTDPGRFVCNHLYYRLLHLTSGTGHCAAGRSVFVHLPATPEMRRDARDVRFFHPLPDLCRVVGDLLDRLTVAAPQHEKNRTA